MTQTKSTHPPKPAYIKDLIILFSVPLAIVLVAALVAYLPRVLANPQHDFIYSYCSSYGCVGDFQVDSSGRIVAIDDHEERQFRRTTTTPQLSYYDTSSDSTRALTVDEASRYQLDKSSKSPDGYSLHRNQSNGGFLFWSSYDDGWNLKDGYKQKPVNLTAGGSYYSRDINFLGWVVQ